MIPPWLGKLIVKSPDPQTHSARAMAEGGRDHVRPSPSPPSDECRGKTDQNDDRRGDSERGQRREDVEGLGLRSCEAREATMARCPRCARPHAPRPRLPRSRPEIPRRRRYARGSRDHRGPSRPEPGRVRESSNRPCRREVPPPPIGGERPPGCVMDGRAKRAGDNTMKKNERAGQQVGQVALSHKARHHHRQRGAVGNSPHATDHPTKISSVNGRTGALGAQMSTGRVRGQRRAHDGDRHRGDEGEGRSGAPPCEQEPSQPPRPG